MVSGAGLMGTLDLRRRAREAAGALPSQESGPADRRRHWLLRRMLVALVLGAAGWALLALVGSPAQAATTTTPSAAAAEIATTTVHAAAVPTAHAVTVPAAHAAIVPTARAATMAATGSPHAAAPAWSLGRQHDGRVRSVSVPDTTGTATAVDQPGTTEAPPGAAAFPNGATTAAAAHDPVEGSASEGIPPSQPGTATATAPRALPAVPDAHVSDPPSVERRPVGHLSADLSAGGSVGAQAHRGPSAENTEPHDASAPSPLRVPDDPSVPPVAPAACPASAGTTHDGGAAGGLPAVPPAGSVVVPAGPAEHAGDAQALRIRESSDDPGSSPD